MCVHTYVPVYMHRYEAQQMLGIVKNPTYLIRHVAGSKQTLRMECRYYVTYRVHKIIIDCDILLAHTWEKRN
jgi:hypothetical protein